MRRAFKFRLYPNRNQERELEIMLETHRRLYNVCLDQRKRAWEEDQINLGYYGQSSWFKNQRLVNKWFEKLNFSSAQATMRRLDKAFQAFFRRVKAGEKPGYPRFKAQGHFGSVEFPAYGDGIRLLLNNKLRVQHIGLIKSKIHRPVEGLIKTVTLKLEADKWFAILSCDLGEVFVTPSTSPSIGIDVGIENFLTTSDGHCEPNPTYLKIALPEMRRANRAVSRKQRGSKNRKKAVKHLRMLHAKIQNLRHNHRHKTALDLIRRYGLIAVERLSIKNMLRNHRLSRAIADAAWGGFLVTLKHKAERAGVSVIEIDARGTSQECSGCGSTVLKELSVRTHQCPHCDLTIHRDINAARVILARALAWTGPAGANRKTCSVA